MAKTRREIQCEYRKRKGNSLKEKEKMRSAERRRAATKEQKTVQNKQGRVRFAKYYAKKKASDILSASDPKESPYQARIDFLC